MRGVRLVIENPQALEKCLNDETNAKTRLKLAFLHCIVTLSAHLTELCKSFGIAESTGYWWIRNWNTQGYNGLLEAETRSGRPPLLDDFDISYLKALLKEKICWTLPEIADLIETNFGVKYSPAQLARILKKRVNMHCCKPYAHDYRRPQEAEAILAQRLQTVFITLKEKGLSAEQIAIGNIDEASPQNHANTVRFWSLDSHPDMTRNTTHFKSSTIGFYALQGVSVQGFIENSKVDSILEFLHQIKEANSNYLAIIIVLDNFASHKSARVVAAAAEMGIYLVYLPPYSPDLSPIEFIWKSIRRELSKRLIINLDDMKNIITEAWKEFSGSLSFAKYWIDKFLRNNQYYSDLCV